MVAGTFEKCCLCISLKSACLLFGYIGAIQSGLILVTLIIVTILSSSGYLVDSPALQMEAEPEFNDPVVAVIVSMAVSLCILIVLVLATDFAFNVSLIVGIYKKKPGNLKAWSIYKLVNIILGEICMLAICIFIKKWYFYLIMATSLVLDSYSWMLVRSYYREMSMMNSNANVFA